MSEQVMGLDKDSNGRNKKSVHAYESAWLGRWARTGVEVVQPSQSRLSLKEDVKCSRETSTASPDTVVGDSAFGKKTEENNGRKPDDEGWDVSPFPIFNVSRQSESITAARTVQNTLCDLGMEAGLPFHEGEGSSSKSMAMRRPLTLSWMHSREGNALSVALTPSFEPLDLIRPMRIYPIVDSGEGTSREPHSFSQTTRHFFLTKNTDLDLPSREPAVSMKPKGEMISGFLGLFPNLDLGRQEGVKLQSLESSKDEVKSCAVCARNESSAETDTMEMDNLQRIRLSGSTSPLSPKSRGRRNQSAVPRVEIPDMNQEPPVIPVDRHGGEASTSETKTQSMKMEHFLSNNESPNKSKRVQPDPERCSTWVKRLKTGASEFSGCGTKSLKIEEASNHFFHRTVKRNLANPEPRNEEQSTLRSKNSKLGGQDITLQHPWIQRLCKNKAETSHQSAGQEVNSEAETSKEAAKEEIQKKQFPSIAAMALMGKALVGLSPSRLRKSGSLISWNTPDIR